MCILVKQNKTSIYKCMKHVLYLNCSSLQNKYWNQSISTGSSDPGIMASQSLTICKQFIFTIICVPSTRRILNLPTTTNIIINNNTENYGRQHGWQNEF